MYYQKDENGKIITTSCDNLPGFEWSDEEIVVSYDRNKLLFLSETQTEEYKIAEAAFIENQNKEVVRDRRLNECFSVINRGKPWYDKLSSEQITELEGWYQKWLDAPQTGNIPDRPTWLK